MWHNATKERGGEERDQEGEDKKEEERKQELNLNEEEEKNQEYETRKKIVGQVETRKTNSNRVEDGNKK